MKAKRIFCIVLAAMLLCACQAGTGPQDIPEDPPALEQSEQETPPSDDRAEKDEEEEKEEYSPYPPAPPVCELDFTETESFPLPFEDELLVDDQGRLLLSTEQALYDYDTMWQLLEENYPYLEAIKRDLGIDWEEVKAEYRQVLEDQASYGYIWQFLFLQTINDCLREFQSVGHLFMLPVQARLNHVTALKNSEDDLNAWQQNIFEMFSHPKTALFYRYVQHLPSLESGSANSASEESEPISTDGLTAITNDLLTGYVGEGVPYLRIASFSQWDDAAQAQLEDFFSSISQEENIIIDVRGNGGGNEGSWMLGIVPFLGQPQKKYVFDWFVASKSGTLNLALEPEFDKSRGYETRYTDDSWQEEFPYISPDLLTGLDVFIKIPTTLTSADIPDKFHGKVWVLIDKYCYSATDSFLSFCKVTGFATLVGTQSGGNGRGYQPYFMALPYSGLIVEYDPGLSFNIDGTCNGTFGTVPDIVQEEGRDALETCLMAINGELP